MSPEQASPNWRGPAVRLIRGGMEAIVLAVMVGSPWAFGAVHADFEHYLYLALALLLALWAVRILVEWTWSWQADPVAIGLAGLFLIGVGQLVAWPEGAIAWLSPGTDRLCHQLLPERREDLAADATLSTGNRISLYPGATRSEAFRLLAVFLLYVVVRNNLTAPEALRRLSIVAVANGAALSLFAILHFFSAPAQMLYWTYSTGGTPFGPFICRNHFSFYVNMCIGLGIGLLLAQRPADSNEEASSRSIWARLLNDPASLWIALALALMVTAVALSLSRGGFLALVLAGLVLAIVQRLSSPAKPMRAGALVTGFLILGLVGWLGLGALQARMKTLVTGTALEEGRLTTWRNTLPLAGDFPLWGTGLGTYQFVEPLRRPMGQPPADVWEHAHNDYLESLIEGGLLRLALSLWIIVLVYRLGIRAVRMFADGQTGALALGALFAFTTTVVHSFVDFGLHVPAIVWLVTVIVAQLCALADSEEALTPEPTPSRGWLTWCVPALATATLLVLALVVGQESRRAAVAERYRLLAQLPDADAARLLDRAIQLAPENALLHQDLAEAHYRLLQEQPDAAHLQAAAAHFMLARDLCPLLVLPQIRLAALSKQLGGAEPRVAYAHRAAILRPFDPEIWYLAGLQEWEHGDWSAARSSWKQALTGSDRHLDDILDKNRPVLTSEELVQQVLPDQPRLLLAAAERLYPRVEDTASRQPFLNRALQLLDQHGTGSAEDFYWRARLYRAGNQPAQSQQAYETALVLVPDRVAWRYELAELLYIQGNFRDARGQLQVILTMQPGHTQAQALLQDVIRQELKR